MNLLDLIKQRRAVCDAAVRGPWKDGGPAFDTVEPPHLFGSVHWEDGLSLDTLRKTTAFIAASRNERPSELDALAIAVEWIEPFAGAKHTAMGKDAARALAQIRAKLENTDAKS